MTWSAPSIAKPSAIALHQPVAGDLRMATAVSRITVELERAGDESKKIAQFAGRMAGGEPQGPVRAVARYLQHMAELTTGMLRDAVRALDESNAELAGASARATPSSTRNSPRPCASC